VKRDSEKKNPVQKISLSGLRGGHSGIDIHTGRGNAIQLLARMLFDIDAPFQLISLEGGSKHNAIPREAFAYIAVQEDKKPDVKKALQERFQEIRFEYKAVEKEMKLIMDDAPDKTAAPLDKGSKERFLALLVGLPHGVMAMSQEIAGLVETSNNLAIVRCNESEISVYTSTRSSILSALEAIRKKIEAVAVLSGAKTKHLEGYPPWTPNLDSAILKTMKEVYKNVSGKDAEIMAIHAGLECGIIGEKFPGMDMISFGPDLQNPHSPDERVHSGSVERFYKLVAATLKVLV
jgi:dipeptidase D